MGEEDARTEEGFERSELSKVLEHAHFARLIVRECRETRVIPVCFEPEECKCGLHFKLTGEGLERIKLRKGDCVTLEFEAIFGNKVIIVIAESVVCHVEKDKDKCCCDKDTTVIVRVKDIDIEHFDDVDCS